MTNPKKRKTNAEIFDIVYSNTLTLINEKDPNTITFSEISNRTGVTRATLYRHWSSPFKLIYDTVQHFTDETNVYTDEEWFSIFKSQSLRDNLIQNLLPQFKKFQNVPRLMRYLVTNMLQDTPEAKEIREDVIHTQRKYTKLTVEAAIQNGELNHPLTELQIDLPLSMLLTNLVTTTKPITVDFISEIVDEIILPSYSSPLQKSQKAGIHDKL